MKNLLMLALAAVLVMAALGGQVVLGNNYSLGRDQVLSRDLVVGGGSAVLEQGSRVTGSLWVTGGSLRANGSIDGDVVLTGGSIAFGPSAVVRGTVKMTGGGLQIAPGASVPPVQSYVPSLPAPIQAYVDMVNWGPIWPLVILVPGLLCLGTMLLLGKRSAWLARPGCFLVVLGLIFLFQNAFNQFQTWAYAWTLLLPTALGLGMYVDGSFGDQPALRERGTRVTRIGLILFTILAALFELAIGLSGLTTGRLLVAALLVLVGALLIMRPRPGTVAPAR